MIDLYGVLGLATIALLILVYFVPAIVAYRRGHHQRNAIAILNLFLGWTLLGWVGALVWSATQVRSAS
ncbi:superinfection immunity protein [Rhodocyclus tenuis]|uniref:Superinfection immunity protein n=1 Tax=Rhodocyclus tenuis TaxID=1066 RepID=A0A840GGD6_RHOTE|nr:superinfection immunity protein [Rhodocyclus tenuis]MBB4247269.1 hypothetical protein [Rhodocyclus tenuis]